jgi:predicted small lipoprotein YifL
MLRHGVSLLIVLMLATAGCGQKGPLVLPQEVKRKPTQPAAHDVPPVQEKQQ